MEQNIFTLCTFGEVFAYFNKCCFVSLLSHHFCALVEPSPLLYENLNEKLLIFLLFSKICG